MRTARPVMSTVSRGAPGAPPRQTTTPLMATSTPSGSKAARRVPCSACGLSKRHLFDEAARTGGYDVARIDALLQKPSPM